MDLMYLAAEEAAAATRKNVAEAEWRRSWWRTSIGVGDLTDAEYRAQAPQLLEVLGHGRGHLTSRRNTARMVAAAVRDSELLLRVPPRLAIEWADRAKRPLDRAGAEHLIAWESDDRSLRELARELGTAGRSWASQEELDEREATVKPSVESIRAALADPEVAREVVAHGPTRANFQGAADSWARETTAGTRWTPPPVNVVQDDRLAQLVGDLMRARELVAEARRISNDLPLDAEVTSGVIVRLEAIAAEAEAMKLALAGHVSFDQALERLGGVR